MQNLDETAYLIHSYTRMLSLDQIKDLIHYAMLYPNEVQDRIEQTERIVYNPSTQTIHLEIYFVKLVR